MCVERTQHTTTHYRPHSTHASPQHRAEVSDSIPLARWSQRQPNLSDLVYKVLARWHTTGSIQAPMTTVGRPRILPGDAIMFIESLLDKDTTLLVDEMKARVSAEFGLDVSTTTLRRTLNSMRCSRKRVTKIAIERNELLRAAFKCRFAELVDNLDMLLCIDESSKDDRTVSRRWVSYTEFGP